MLGGIICHLHGGQSHGILDSHSIVFRGQHHIGPATWRIRLMDGPKRAGRPKTREVKPPTKTAKLSDAPGRASRFTISISSEQRIKLAYMAERNGISEAEQIRRLIDEAKL